MFQVWKFHIFTDFVVSLFASENVGDLSWRRARSAGRGQDLATWEVVQRRAALGRNAEIEFES